ncbi:MAG: glycosyltransferase family 39 protein [Pseudomonadota bacterium]
MKKKHYLLLFLILLLAFAFRIYKFDAYSLWDDEARTYITASARNLPDVLKVIPIEIPGNSPLDPLVRHLFMKMLGNNTFNFMLPSLIFSLIALLILFYFAKKIFGLKVALISALILSFHPFDIVYAQEGRNYAILNIFSPLATLFLIRAMQEKAKLRNWIFYGLMLSLLFYSHMITMSFAVAQCFFIVAFLFVNYIKTRKIDILLFRNYLFAGILSVLLFIPWLVVFLQTGWISWLKDVTIVHHSALKCIMLFAPGYSIFKLISIILFIFGSIFLYKKEKQIFWLFVSMFVIASMLAFFITKNSFFHVRYIFYLLPFIVLVIAIGLSYLSDLFMSLLKTGLSPNLEKYARPNYFIVFILICIFSNNLLALKPYYKKGGQNDGNWKKASVYINENYKPGDAIILPHGMKANFEVYNDIPSYFIYYHESKTRINEDLSENKMINKQWKSILFNIKDLFDPTLAEYFKARNTGIVYLIWIDDKNYENISILITYFSQYGSIREMIKFDGALVFKISIN